MKATLRANGSLRAGVAIVVLMLTLTVAAPVVAPYDPLSTGPAMLEGPSLAHPMGTDALGRDLFSRILFGARLSLGAALLTMLLIAPEFVSRLDTIRNASNLVTGESGGEGPDGAILGRTTSNLAALLVFVDHPIVGVGPNLYAAQYSQDYGNELGLRHLGTSRRAHNMYLEWAAELGILGLAAGVGALVLTIVQLRALRRYWRWRRPAYSNMAGAYALALVAYMGTAVFLHLSYERYFFTLLALANAVIWTLSRERAILESHMGSVTGKNAPTATLSRWLPPARRDRTERQRLNG